MGLKKLWHIFDGVLPSFEGQLHQCCHVCTCGDLMLEVTVGFISHCGNKFHVGYDSRNTHVDMQSVGGSCIEPGRIR